MHCVIEGQLQQFQESLLSRKEICHGFASKVSQEQVPNSSKVPRGSQEQVPKQLFPARGSQARFPGTCSQARF